jgi:hypothetical protein
MKNAFFQTSCYVAGLLGILFIPFPFRLLSVQQYVTNPLAQILVSFAANISGIFLPSKEITSDSASMYLLVLILAFISLLIALLLVFNRRWVLKSNTWFKYIRIVFTYYVALQLLNYGFDKIFKSQFFLPEPNTLYTTFGRMNRDLLFWSTIGTSHFYSLFSGLIEVIPALLMLFKKTRTIGAILAGFVLLNIAAINIGFDISVKLYSFFLFFLIVMILWSNFKSLYIFFAGHPSILIRERSVLHNRSAYIVLKIFIIGLIFLETLYPHLKKETYNDDLAERPFLHGSYDVKKVTRVNDTIPEMPGEVKRFHVHRNGYLIFEDHDNKMRDFKMEINPIANRIILTGYDGKSTSHNYVYSKADSTLQLQYFTNGRSYMLQGKMTDWKKLPAVRNDFHWTSDSYY